MGTPAIDANRQIIPPADFPVIWANPQDAAHHWTRDREHNPLPVTPMFSSVADLTAGPGYRKAVNLYQESVLRRHDRTINGYGYTRLEVFEGTPEALSERMQHHRKKVGQASQCLGQTWEKQWRPQIEAHWSFWASFDLPGASLAALARHVQESLERLTRMYEIHYLMGAPMWFALDEFEQFYCDLFPGSTPLDAHQLLQGFDNKTLQIGRSLWRLSRLARAIPTVQRMLESRPPKVALERLQSIPEAGPFVAELRQFVQQYGRRSDLWDWGYPSWEDDPTPLLTTLKTYLSQSDRDLQAERVQAAARREAAIALTLQALQGYPQPVIERFRSLLSAAQVALVLSEDHTYYLDFNGFGWMHRVVLECGRRLHGQGRLRQPADAFYLTIQELQAALVEPAMPPGELAARRRAEAEFWATYPEPGELGTRPEKPPYIYSPESRRMMRYIGGFLADEPSKSQDPNQLTGQPGSPGVVRGPARLIPSLAEAHRLQPGDILVTTTTAPPWTPLFLTAAGLVTDAGGLLSHGAVVCREYHLPAVVGAHQASLWLQDGEWIEVDGSRGIVTRLEVAEAIQIAVESR